jgi:hypothetical protein
MYTVHFVYKYTGEPDPFSRGLKMAKFQVEIPLFIGAGSAEVEP